MYEYKGITTNNLKDISVEFKDNEIVYIGGASGSGKSSLAFDTIAAISESEYGTLVKDNKVSVRYRIKEYGNVLVAATLKQLNFNVNPRSIILTYFGLYPYLANILSQYTGLDASSFSLNGPHRCRECNGLGYIDVVDELLIVDPTRSIKEMPFKCWDTSYLDFFSQLLHNFCQEQNIDETKKFGELSESTRELLLRGKGKSKYKISYNLGGKKRTKTSPYIGPILGMESGMKDMFGMNVEKFSKASICPECKGCRLTPQVYNCRVIDEINVKFILSQSMDMVYEALKSIQKNSEEEEIKCSCGQIIRFIDSCKKLNVSYLNLSRGISTLSGGELQRLRMVQLSLGKLKNLLIVLDEPTGSLNPKEAAAIVSIILELKQNNTVIVVDHNKDLRKIADRAYFLGPKGGVYGGELIKETDYLKMQECQPFSFKKAKTETISVTLKSDYVNYSGDLTIYVGTLNALSGVSGIGKTTILRDILPYQVEFYKYITQKPIKGNRNSTVASYTKLSDEVRNYYAMKTKKSKKIFSLFQDGACPKCGGKGSIIIGELYSEQLFIDCEECEGTGYRQDTLKELVDGININDFLNQSIEEIIDKNISVSKKFDKTVQLLKKMGLSHLSLNQKVSTLSGGENQRIKLSQALGEGRTKIYGLDEPSKGLGRKEMIELIKVIYENIEEKGRTFVISEHNPEFLELCEHRYELRKKDNSVILVKQ